VIICDTGVLLAVANDKDSAHEACVAALDAESGLLDHRHFRQISPKHCAAFHLLPGEHELPRYR
jgi:hypothetical protein